MAIYLDNAASMKTRAEALAAAMPYLAEEYGNPSSLHTPGLTAKKAIQKAREDIATCLWCKPSEIVFTSGGTESDNLAIKGFFEANKGKGKHIITTNIEHPAVSESIAWLKTQGAEVTVLAVDGEGLITAEQVARVIRPNTILVAVQFANNEIGTIQPIAEIATVAKERGVACFVDAVQAVGHLPFALGSTEGAGKLPLGATPRDYEGITMLSAAAHKFGGPKGVGFLFVREGTKLAPVLHGGPQEMHLRAGTENVPGIVGTAAALIVSCRELRENLPRVRALRDMMMHRITGEIPDSRVNGSRIHRLAGNVNVSFSGVEASSILVLMDMAGIACSGGSACSSASGKPSHVIEALHIPHEYENGTVRLTISPDTTQAEIDGAVTALAGIVAKLREGRKV
ncbi:MAG: cysteine desulfurase [Lachnospiraceae bacterium]|nr:cysteine desulfurase [Lachnospiraceae bacterium]